MSFETYSVPGSQPNLDAVLHELRVQENNLAIPVQRIIEDAQDEIGAQEEGLDKQLRKIKGVIGRRVAQQTRKLEGTLDGLIGPIAGRIGEQGVQLAEMQTRIGLGQIMPAVPTPLRLAEEKYYCVHRDSIGRDIAVHYSNAPTLPTDCPRFQLATDRVLSGPYDTCLEARKHCLVVVNGGGGGGGGGIDRWDCVNGMCVPVLHGRFTSEAECKLHCLPPPPDGKKFWCVREMEARNGGPVEHFVCRQSELRPANTVGGPYDTQQECDAQCKSEVAAPT